MTVINRKGKSYKRHLLRNAEPDPQAIAFKAAVNRMWNNARNQWARKGYPGLKRKDVTKLPMPFWADDPRATHPSL